jgi:NDP-sugar pyrophosphorylase family protein
MAVLQNVHMGVDEPGEHNAVLQVNDRRIIGDDCGIKRSDIGNSVILDNHSIGEFIIIP